MLNSFWAWCLYWFRWGGGFAILRFCLVKGLFDVRLFAGGGLLGSEVLLLWLLVSDALCGFWFVVAAFRFDDVLHPGRFVYCLRVELVVFG